MNTLLKLQTSKKKKRGWGHSRFVIYTKCRGSEMVAHGPNPASQFFMPGPESILGKLCLFGPWANVFEPSLALHALSLNIIENPI